MEKDEGCMLNELMPRLRMRPASRVVCSSKRDLFPKTQRDCGQLLFFHKTASPGYMFTTTSKHEVNPQRDVHLWIFCARLANNDVPLPFHTWQLRTETVEWDEKK